MAIYKKYYAGLSFHTSLSDFSTAFSSYPSSTAIRILSVVLFAGNKVRSSLLPIQLWWGEIKSWHMSALKILLSKSVKNERIWTRRE